MGLGPRMRAAWNWPRMWLRCCCPACEAEGRYEGVWKCAVARAHVVFISCPVLGFPFPFPCHFFRQIILLAVLAMFCFTMLYDLMFPKSTLRVPPSPSKFFRCVSSRVIQSLLLPNSNPIPSYSASVFKISHGATLGVSSFRLILPCSSFQV